jgi:anaphase-promoting complex subunit 1
VLRLSSFNSPPCILSWIDALVSGRAIDCGYDSLHEWSINATCTTTRSLLRIFSVLYDRDKNAETSNDDRQRRRDRDHNVVKMLIEEGFTDKVLLRDELPAGVVVPLLEVLYRCRSDNELLGLTYEDAEMWSLIGRDDLCKNAQNTENDFSVNGAPRNNPGIPVSSDPSNDQNRQLEDKDKDGVCPLEITSSMLFPDDNRIREVARLLRSSRPTYLNVPRAIEVSDHDYERLKQEKLLLLSRRVLALPVGRGMFTIGNLQPVPAEPLPLPEISLVGRVPPTNAMLALDTSETPADLKVWPEFHNGVAAGLRLPLEADAGEIISKITRTWIVYNRPDESAAQSQNNTNNNSASPPPSPIHAHGGLLMALGLRGHLTTLEMTDIFDYLTQGTVTTTVGVLLGMAVK